ncbi:MAG: shikimate kinase [Sediminicola sp.]|tara:strand:- start:17555 stop:18070 length:516 start_codon:yes stop_codon:yes gene_type:complete
MKIVLVGYMGSGKTTVGKELSKELKISFLDMDAYLEERMGMGIPHIFKEKGELFFRKLEHDCLHEIMEHKDNFVLSTGGGTPCYGGNMDTISQYTPNVFYLRVSLSELLRRLSPEKKHRPLISDIKEEDLPEFLGKHLFERNSFYTRAKHTISADTNEIRTIVEGIKELLS